MIETSELEDLRRQAAEHKSQVRFHRKRLRWTQERITELESRLSRMGIRFINPNGVEPRREHGRNQS